MSIEVTEKTVERVARALAYCGAADWYRLVDGTKDSFRRSARAAIAAMPASGEGVEAARYRWLRSEHERHDPAAAVSWKRNMDREENEWVNTASADQLDRLVDAARGEGNG